MRVAAARAIEVCPVTRHQRSFSHGAHRFSVG
jgi:hypothetical protein